MPYLPASILETAVFLYPTQEDAEKRTKWGGSGFLIGIDSEANPSLTHMYAVSNEHVSTPCPVIRLTNGEGEVEIVPGMDADWIEHPDGDDVAVRPLGAVPTSRFSSRYLGYSVERLLTREDLRFGAGPVVGDDCFMVGRYINHEGKQFDRPVARFGNLSMLPESVWQEERSFDQESFLVDMRSVAGFSGSQVVVYFTEPGTVSLFSTGGPQMPLRDLVSKYWVLGIDWGHLPVAEKIVDEDGVSRRVKVKSSMAAVVPAWKLTELLNDVEAVVKPREKAETELAQVNENAAEPDAHRETEFERFEELTRRIVKVPKAEIDEQRKES